MLNPFDELLTVLADFEQHATPAEKKAAILPLQRLSRKLEIRSLELLEQRLLLTRAEGSRDKRTLRDLADFSQFPEITSWSEEVLNPKPRTGGGLGFAVN